MKKILLIAFLLCLVSVPAWAMPPMPPGGNAATATALAADPANCGAGQIALGITAEGVAECTASPTVGTLTAGSANSITVGTDSAGGGPAIGSIIFHNATNTNHFSLISGTTGAAIGWTLPTAAAAGNDYLVKASTAGVLSYTDPATFQTPTGTPAGFIIAGQAIGDILQANSTTTWARLASPAVGAFLRSGGVGTVSAWSTFTLASPGAANALLGSGGTNWDRITSISLDNAGAQFYDSAAPTSLIMIDPVSVTAGTQSTWRPVASGAAIFTNDTVGAGTYKYAFKETANAFTGINTFTSGTLNLPSADADPGTTAGQIKHDTTNTAANSGGIIQWYDGAQVRSLVDTGTNYTIITKTEFLLIAWAVDGATAPSALAAVTGKEINARSFTEADDVVFWWVVPNDYVGGVKYRVHYALSANASADDTAVFSMAGSIVGNSGDLDGSAGTALTISDELTTDDDQYQYMVTDYSAESNADWSIVAGGLARLNFSHAAASDMVGAGEPLVIGIEIKYKAKIIGIAGY